MSLPSHRPGFTLLELIASAAVTSALLAVLIPTLSVARTSSYRAECANNLRQLGRGWTACIEDRQGRLPIILEQPEWLYGGVRYSSIDDAPFLDFDRPLNRFVAAQNPGAAAEQVYCCPADDGIHGAEEGVGTGERSACEAFGASYRSNTKLLTGQLRDAGSTRALSMSQITTPLSRLVVLGDAGWFESYESTGRSADWHGTPSACNMLFLDGSVRYLTVAPRPGSGAMMFDPFSP